VTEDVVFHRLFVAGFVAVMAVALYHRVRSWASREKLDRWQEGPFVLVTLRLAGLVLWLSVFAYMIDPQWMSFSHVALHAGLRWAGVGLGAASAVLLWWTLRSLGTNLTDTVVTRRDHTLITHGPYRWVRHPFYGCVALLIVAICLIAANWFFLAAGALVFGLIGIRTRTEERFLAARFGETYRAYMATTGRFVPRRPVSRRSS